MERTCEVPLNVILSQLMQRKVNYSDSDYHYSNKKLKQNVLRMMTECKQLGEQRLLPLCKDSK